MGSSPNPVTDLHTHLRNEIAKHTKFAKSAGINTVVYMANSNPPLDSLEALQQSLRQKRFCKALPVGALTKGLAGKELVDIDRLKPYVVGFSDDGLYLEDLGLLKRALEKNVLILAHCSPKYDIGIKNPELETKYIENYLKVLKTTGGKLHIQHVSQKESVSLIRTAKKNGLTVTCETCPQYFSFTRDNSKLKVNPPLATKSDVLAIKQGLQDGTIDVIASDYAPEPRETGTANFKAFLELSHRLVLEGVLTKRQLEEKLSTNPKRIIEQN